MKTINDVAFPKMLFLHEGRWLTTEEAERLNDHHGAAVALREYNRSKIAGMAEFIICMAIIIGLFGLVFYASGGLR